MPGDPKIFACPMALDILKWDVGDLPPDLFDVRAGMTRFLFDVESGKRIVI